MVDGSGRSASEPMRCRLSDIASYRRFSRAVPDSLTTGWTRLQNGITALIIFYLDIRNTKLSVFPSYSDSSPSQSLIIYDED